MNTYNDWSNIEINNGFFGYWNGRQNCIFKDANHKLRNNVTPRIVLLVVCVHGLGRQMSDRAGKGNASPYVKVSQNCLLLGLGGACSISRGALLTERRDGREQMDYHQGHSAPLLSPAVVVVGGWVEAFTWFAHRLRLRRRARLGNVSLIASECCVVPSDLPSSRPG